MKNKFLLLLLAGMSVFTACNDDDDKKGPKDLNGTFTTTDEANRLVLSYSDAALAGKTATFTSTDGRTATIELSGNQIVLGTMNIPTPGVIPGEKTTKLNVELIADGLGGYTFEGVDEANNRTLNYKGSIEEGKLTLNLNAVFSNELLGTWNLRAYNPNPPSSPSLPFRLVWNTSEKLQVPMFGQSIPMGIGDLLTLACGFEVVDGIIPYEVIGNLLQNVTFGTDGNVIASYSDAANLGGEPVWQDSQLNLMHYVLKDEKLYAYLNVESIMELILPTLGRATGEEVNVGEKLKEEALSVILAKLPELLPLLSDGIPLGYELTEEGDLAVYIDMEVGLMIKDIAVELLTKIVNDAELFDYVVAIVSENPMTALIGGADGVKSVLQQLPQVLNTTTEMEIGLNLVKATDAE